MMANIYFLKFPLENSLGGAEFYTLKLAKHFSEIGIKIKLLTSDSKLFRLFEKFHLPRHHLFVGWEPTSKQALLKWPVTCFLAKYQFKKILKGISPNGVFFLQSLTEKLTLTHPAPDKIFWLEHKIPGRWLWQNPLLPLYLKLAKDVRLITVSNFAKQEFVNLGVPSDNITVIYPGVKPTSCQLLATSYYTIGLLSRLHSEKGVHDFLENVYPALRKHPDWKVLIAGEGPEKSKIENFIKNRCLESQVRAVGFVSNLNKFFSQISVLVYPSLVPEAFGMTVLEAQSRGIPVIASRIGALAEIIDHEKTGFLIGSDRKEEWVRYLEALTEKKLYIQISNGALLRLQNFSESKMFEQFNQLLFNENN